MKTEDNMVLTTSLQAAVPLWILEMRPWTPAARLATAREDGQHIAEHGDDLMFKSKTKGRTAEAFNHLARGLAALAYAPGGVTFAGEHWCVNHAECTEAANAA